jgi:hypothetical protein
MTIVPCEGIHPNIFPDLLDSSIFHFDLPFNGTFTDFNTLSQDIRNAGPKYGDPALLAIAANMTVTKAITKGKPATLEQKHLINHVMDETMQGRHPEMRIQRTELYAAILYLGKLTTERIVANTNQLNFFRTQGQRHLDSQR